MSKKMDVTVDLSEVLARLNSNGALRKALIEVAEAKAGGQSVGAIRLAGGTGLSDKDLKSVVGGATSGGTIDYSTLSSPTASASAISHADTRW
jgi:hypothetical protein